MLSFQTRFRPAMLVFLLWVIGGVVGVTFRKGVIGVWYIIESIFIGVLALISGGSTEENERAIKYYIFQSIGSLLIFLSLLRIFCRRGFSLHVAYSLFCWGVMVKLGLFPFQFWVPAVLGLCSWRSFFVIRWIQKIPSLWLIVILGVPLSFTGIFEARVWITVIIGALSGVGVLQYRVLLAFSSLVQTGWFVMLSLCRGVVIFIYIFIYGLTLGIVLVKLNHYNVFSYLDHTNFRDWSGSSWRREVKKVGLFLDLASLAGIPPFLGRVGKFVGVFYLWSNYYISRIILVLRSLFTFYFYLSIILNFMVGLGLGGMKNFSKFHSKKINTFWNRSEGLNKDVIFHTLCFLLRSLGGFFLLRLLGFLS